MDKSLDGITTDRERKWLKEALKDFAKIIFEDHKEFLEPTKEMKDHINIKKFYFLIIFLIIALDIYDIFRSGFLLLYSIPVLIMFAFAINDNNNKIRDCYPSYEQRKRIFRDIEKMYLEEDYTKLCSVYGYKYPALQTLFIKFRTISRYKNKTYNSD